MPTRLSRSTTCGKLLAAALLISFNACKSKDEKSAVPTTLDAATAKIAPVAMTGDLIGRVPANSFAVLRYEISHPANAKLLASPWGGNSEFAEMLQGSNPTVERVRKIFAVLGVDPEKPDVASKVCSDSVFFAAPGQTPESPVAGGMICTSAPEFSFKNKLDALKTTLVAEGMKVEDVDVAPGVGIKIHFKTDVQPDASMGMSDGTPPNTVEGNFVLAANDKIHVVASHVDVAKQVLASQGTTPPAILSTDTLSRALAGTPGEKERFATGLVDVQKFVAEVQKLAIDPQAQEALKALPALQAAAFSFSMSDSPRTDIRFLFDPEKGAESFVTQLSGSESKTIVDGLPAKPLLFLSIDGATLKRAKDSALKSIPPEQQAMLADLSVLDTVKRIAITAKVSEPGKSLLPVPDMLIAIDSSDPEKAAEVLRNALQTALAQSGMPPSGGWAKRTVGAATVQTLPAGFGFNLSVGTTSNLVLVSSSEGMMNTMLNPAGPSTGGFAKSLSGASSRVLADASTVGNLYVDFNEVGTLLETMGGLLQMYAPQDPTAAKLVSPEHVANLKKMGAMVASVEVGENVVGVQSFYQPSS